MMKQSFERAERVNRQGPVRWLSGIRSMTLLFSVGFAMLGFSPAQAGPLSTITVGNSDPDRVTTDANSPSIANCSFQEAVFIATADPPLQESNDCRISPLGGPPPYVIEFTSAFTIQPDDMPTIDEDIIIEGPVTLDGTDQSPLFTLASDTSITLDAAGVPLLFIVENCTSSCIRADSSTSTVNTVGVLFQDNSTSGDGAAIRAGGTLNVSGSTFINNSADGQGGAIRFSGSSLLIDLSIFGGPLLGNTSDDNGGALYLTTSATTSSWSILGSAFIENSSMRDGGSQGGNGGGAIYANNSSGTTNFAIVASEFLDNSAPNGSGGALAFGLSNQIGFSAGASTIGDLSTGGIFASHFNGNTAGGVAGPAGAGGAIHNRGDEMAIVASSFENNSSTNSSGGAIAENGGGDSVLVNVTMNNNTAATDGGAIIQLGGFGGLEILNSTIAGNSAGNEGGGIWNTSNSFSVVNSIVADNTANPMGMNPGANCGGPDDLINGGNNLQFDPGMDTTVCGGGTPFATGDPDLGTFQYNGGVHLLVESMDLGPNSAAHGGGSTTVCSNFPVLGLDARDVIPVRPDPSGSSCDIGAFESNLGPPALDLTPDVGLDFMNLVVGQISTLQATLTNTGDLVASNVQLMASGGDFTLTNDTCSGGPLAGMASCTVDVEFAPMAAGAQSQILTATADGGLLDSISLDGTGQAPATIDLLPDGGLDFAMVETGMTASLTATLSNSGDVPATGLMLSFTGGDFSLNNDTCAGSVPAAGSCTVDVVFAPLADGAQTETLQALADTGLMDSIAVTGTGFTPSALVITPDPIDFMLVETGQSSIIPLTVDNTGGQTTGTLSLMVSGGEFSVQNDTCSGNTLAPAGTCTLDMEFAPTADGAQNEMFTVDDGSGTSDMVALTGTGFTPAGLDIQPDPIDFMQIETGQTSTLGVTVSNTGSQTTGALSLLVSGGEFALLNDTCSGNTLAAASSCTVDVQFAPTADGAQSETLSADDGAGALDSAALTGTGFTPAAILALTPDPVAFGNVETGMSNTIQVTLANTGMLDAMNVVLSVSGGDFTLMNDTCPATLQASANCTVDVVFAPAADGAQTETLTASATGVMDAASLTGTGFTPTGDLDLTPDQGLDFGNQEINTNSSLQFATVENTGAIPLNNLSSAISGDFSRDGGTCGTSLAPAASCTVGVRFLPTALGALTGTLTITAAAGAMDVINLTGAGVPPGPGPVSAVPVPVDDARWLLLLMLVMLSVGALAIRRNAA